MYDQESMVSKKVPYLYGGNEYGMAGRSETEILVRDLTRTWQLLGMTCFKSNDMLRRGCKVMITFPETQDGV